MHPSHALTCSRSFIRLLLFSGPVTRHRQTFAHSHQHCTSQAVGTQACNQSTHNHKSISFLNNCERVFRSVASRRRCSMAYATMERYSKTFYSPINWWRSLSGQTYTSIHRWLLSFGVRFGSFAEPRFHLFSACCFDMVISIVCVLTFCYFCMRAVLGTRLHVLIGTHRQTQRDKRWKHSHYKFNIFMAVWYCPTE